MTISKTANRSLTAAGASLLTLAAIEVLNLYAELSGLLLSLIYFPTVLLSIAASALTALLWLGQLVLRKPPSWHLLPFLVFAGVSVGGFIFFSPLIKHALLYSIMARGEPIIVALEQYKRDHRTYPEKLYTLVPRYLKKLPTTGFSYHQEFYYDKQEKAYSLSVPMPRPWDELFYEPDQRYDGLYGGTVDRLGKWAYLNE